MKKIISVFISICIVVTVFAGCSKDKADEQVHNLPITYDSHYADYDTSAMSAYENLCNAVIKGEEEVVVIWSYIGEIIIFRLWFVGV